MQSHREVDTGAMIVGEYAQHSRRAVGGQFGVVTPVVITLESGGKHHLIATTVPDLAAGVSRRVGRHHASI
jgi:hypothetical protein